MTCRALILAALLVALSACANSPSRVRTDGRADTGRGPVTDASTLNSERDIVLAVANPLEPTATHAGSNLLDYAPSRFYGAGQRAASILAELKQSYGMREVAGWPIKALNLYCVVLETPPGMTREALLATLAKDDRVQLAQPLQDYAVYAQNPQTPHPYNDPYANLQRGFVETDAALAHDETQGKGVHIAVVDTGIDTTHPDLKGNIGETHNLVDDNASTFNHDAHGTEVAGIIAAVGDNHQGMVGMAPKSVLSIYKACWYPPASDAGAGCNSFTLAKALAAIIDTDTRIVNLSLGGPADPLLNMLLAQLLSQGRIVIAAMPPDGNVGGFPDNAPGVIVVRVSGATTAPPGVLSAPGNDILTTQPGGGYNFISGSSMAAAHVSGITALLLDLAPKLDARTVRDLLLGSSKVSNGMLQVNAASAVAALRETQTPAH